MPWTMMPLENDALDTSGCLGPAARRRFTIARLPQCFGGDNETGRARNRVKNLNAVLRIRARDDASAPERLYRKSMILMRAAAAAAASGPAFATNDAGGLWWAHKDSNLGPAD